MRVPDLFIKSVAFVAELTHSDNTGDEFDYVATGFFVAVPSVVQQTFYFHFVTAKHVAAKLDGRNIAFLVNTKSGGVTTITMGADKWFFHPNDESVDVAVLPANLTADLDVITVGTSDFATPEMMLQQKVGIGDELFIPGLFTYAVGRKRQMPIIRHGTLAMVPEDPIQVESHFAEVYLIEARSIGGLSGSPVFVRCTLKMPRIFGPTTEDFIGLSSRPYLLGMMHGHWDIRESDLNKTSFIHDRQRGVNLGIGVVVPAHKILEVINHPDLVSMRETREEQLRKAVSPGPDA